MSMPATVNDQADELIASLRSRRRAHVFVISGPSGVGKDSVIELLRPRLPDVHFAVTATTRPRRPGEIDGIHYYFLEPDTFAEREAQGEFLESANVYGLRYGVPKWGIREALARNQDVIVKVDVQGAATIRAMVPDATFIFIAPETLTALLHRLRSRKTDDPEALMRRFNTATQELSAAADFDYVIFNEDDQLDRALAEIHAVIVARRCRTEQIPIQL
ncbi:MAG TPA: guanylate kinase [Thermomicrobiales bacterium]|jgi:guanylate kinase|nr:guanylate kinase [Thermomicrobiales bacterium]